MRMPTVRKRHKNSSVRRWLTGATSLTIRVTAVCAMALGGTQIIAEAIPFTTLNALLKDYALSAAVFVVMGDVLKDTIKFAKHWDWNDQRLTEMEREEEGIVEDE